jgi:hypothetical protein
VETGSVTIKTATVAGTPLEYSERGEGEPLLLVHAGVFADWFVPLAASRTLDGFRVIRVRRAGRGGHHRRGLSRRYAPCRVDGHPATSKTIRIPFCVVFTFTADDKLKAEFAYYDRLSIMSQLGVMAVA